MEGSSRLARTYRYSKALATQGYLKRTFPGRQILTRLRIDDLDLGAASFRGKADVKEACALCGLEEETKARPGPDGKCKKS